MESSRFAYAAALAEWRDRASAHYGTGKLLSQTNCDFIDENTCVAVDLVETTDAKGQAMRHK